MKFYAETREGDSIRVFIEDQTLNAKIADAIVRMHNWMYLGSRFDHPQKITMIKAFREITDCGLKDSKDCIEAALERFPAPSSIGFSKTQEDFDREFFNDPSNTQVPR